MFTNVATGASEKFTQRASSVKAHSEKPRTPLVGRRPRVARSRRPGAAAAAAAAASCLQVQHGKRILRLVLVGGGHAHCHVVRALRPQQIGFIGVLISVEEHALYSGMLPGRIAGQYEKTAVRIDLLQLTHTTSWLFLRGRVVGICHREKYLEVELVASGPYPERIQLYYDVLSIDVGSSTRVPAGLEEVPSQFVQYTRPILDLEAFFETSWGTDVPSRQMTGSASASQRVLVMGGGAAGAELCFALHRRCQVVGKSAFRIYWLVAEPQPFPAKVQQLVRKLARERGIRLVQVPADARFRLEPNSPCKVQPVHDLSATDALVTEARDSRFVLSWSADGSALERLACDVLILATGAAAPKWLAEQTDLAVSPDGFVLVQPTLQTLSSADVFAAGDCIAWSEHPEMHLPKAGVYAVRQAPILTENLRCRLVQLIQQHLKEESSRETRNCRLRVYRPQKRYLSILNTADGHGIAFRGQWMAYGRWVWLWKNMLDRLWMAKYPKPASAEIFKADQHPTSDASHGALHAAVEKSHVEPGSSRQRSLRAQVELALILYFCATADAFPPRNIGDEALEEQIGDQATRALFESLWQRNEPAEAWHRELSVLTQRLRLRVQYPIGGSGLQITHQQLTRRNEEPPLNDSGCNR
jgi:NADH dehydrogenase FAD-containing subunit